MKPNSDESQRDKFNTLSQDEYEGRGENSAREKQPGDWLLKLGMISGVVLALVAACGLIYVSVIRKLDFPTVSGGSGDVELPLVGDSGEPAGLGEAQSLDRMRRALAIRMTSQVAEVFIISPEVESVAVLDFLKALPEREGLVVGIEYLEPQVRDGIVIEKLRVHFRNGEAKHHLDAHLIKDDDGEWKVDYGSFVNQVPPRLPQEETE